MRVNTLVSSVGRKTPLLEVLRQCYANLGLAGEIVGGDSDSQALGPYFCDRFLCLPATCQVDAFQNTLEFLNSAGISIVIPTRDGELPFYAGHRQEFERHGIHVMVSPPQAIATVRDKLQFAHSLRQWGFPSIDTASTPDDLPSGTNYFVVKSRRGAGGREVFLKLSKESALRHGQELSDPIYQPFVSGKEYSVDLYMDLQGEPVGAMSRERILVENGESQITVSCRMPQVEELCLSASRKLGIRGHALFQVIVDSEGQAHIVECNCRFGGASPLSYAMGLKSFDWFITEVLFHKKPTFFRSATEKKLIRYKRDRVIDL